MSQRTLAKKLALVKSGMLLVGVDLAQQNNVALILTDRAQQLTRFPPGVAPFWGTHS